MTTKSTTQAPFAPGHTPVTVITTCYGRNRHLYNLLSSLTNGSIQPDEVIIVNDDADPNRLAEYDLNIVQIATTADIPADSHVDVSTKSAFDIGHNRNLGAARATHDVLIFLDVDCIVAPTFIEQLKLKVQQHPQALLMGQPRYLTRPLSDEESVQLRDDKLSVSHLNALSVYNPYRDNFDNKVSNPADTNQTAIKQTQDYGAFWSLCFAITRQQFDRIGGFDTQYTGYGAEDTDFAFTARQLNIDFYLTADVVYHQQHSVYRPPLNHLDSIVINANRFYHKWQCWPMSGWLSPFAEMGLIHWQAEQIFPIESVRQPTCNEIEEAHCPDAPYV
ncbi:glycosyltransferase [Psychrobacter sp. B38]|uniref:glycosyltransferase family 2 protein n=1 Tax=Psychrobacter sp. B38 TaxID=3143538 RepID=UPI00320FF526